MATVITDQIGFLIRQYPDFKDLLQKSVALAIEKGHSYLDSFHYFAAILREIEMIPWSTTVLPASTYAMMEEILWQLVQPKVTQPAIIRVAPGLLYMIHSTIADTLFLGLRQPGIHHVFLFFLTRPKCVPYDIFERLSVTREDLIIKVIRETERNRADILINYYTRMHNLLNVTWHELRGTFHKLSPLDYVEEG